MTSYAVFRSRPRGEGCFRTTGTVTAPLNLPNDIPNALATPLGLPLEVLGPEQGLEFGPEPVLDPHRQGARDDFGRVVVGAL
jgi:hypothetical protein